jgi:hypothetical protein
VLRLGPGALVAAAAILMLIRGVARQLLDKVPVVAIKL